MRKSGNFHKISLLLLILAITVTGCASLAHMFSPAWDAHNKAVEDWKQGNTIEALIKMTEAIETDPKLPDPYKFMIENFEDGIASILGELKSQGSKSEMEYAERKAYLYSSLVKLYKDLSRLELPYTDPEEGKWTWDVEIVDYSKEAEESRQAAFDILYKEAKSLLAIETLKEAETIYRRAVSKYLNKGTDEANAAIEQIANDYCDFADPLNSSAEINDLYHSTWAYNMALNVIKGFERAVNGRNIATTNAADLFCDSGETLEAKNDVDSKILAVGEYEKALEWKPEYERAVTLLTNVKTSIAEHYYQEGLKWENSSRNDEAIKNAITNYEEAVKWVEGYKDAEKRKFSILISEELTKLSENLKTAQSEFEKISDRVARVSDGLNKSMDIMNTISDVAEKSRNLNTNMKKTYNVLVIFNPIPYLGTVTSVLSKSINFVQEPLEKAVKKIDKVEEAVVDPIKNVLEKLITITDAVAERLEKVETSLNYSSKTVDILNDCVANQQDAKLLAQVEDKTKYVNKAFVEINKVLAYANTGLDKVDGVVSKIASAANIFSKVRNGLKVIDPIMSKVSSITGKIDSALSKEFTLNLLVKKYKFSVKKILTGLPGAVKSISGKFMDLAMGALKPIMNELNINIPSVPGLSDLQDELDKYTERFNTIKDQATAMKDSVTNIDKYTGIITDNLEAIWDATGCSGK